MTSYQIKPVTSVKEYMEAVWTEQTKRSAATTVFRGQTEAWCLLPKLCRVDKPPHKLRVIEHKLMELFKDRSLYLMPSVPHLPYDMLSLMQHHGLNTRLLDWSSNPLMALFFAVDALAPKQPVVWIYSASSEEIYKGVLLSRQANVLEQKSTILIQPTCHSQRVVAQAGWHTVHQLAGSPDDDTVRAVAMNEGDDANQLSLIPLHPSKSQPIKKELRDMGIHAATVYGDLTSICREMQDELAADM